MAWFRVASTDRLKCGQYTATFNNTDRRMSAL
jgi:hypothetical protein